VRTPAIVVRHPLGEHASHMAFAERNHKVETLSTNRANQPFAEADVQRRTALCHSRRVARGERAGVTTGEPVPSPGSSPRAQIRLKLLRDEFLRTTRVPAASSGQVTAVREGVAIITGTEPKKPNPSSATVTFRVVSR
jgi:hypothetical protein